MGDTIGGKLAEAGIAVAVAGEKVEKGANWVKEIAQQAQNRADEAKDEVAIEAKEAKIDADAKAEDGNCGVRTRRITSVERRG